MRSYASIIVLLLASFLAVLSSCSVIENTTSYLTPIPKATVSAYQWDAPIKTKLQAVIAARAVIDTTRLEYVDIPQVVSADELKFEDTRKFLDPQAFKNFENNLRNTMVWVVIFTGDWRVIPPGSQNAITPDPPLPGCVYVLLDTQSGMNISTGSLACPSEK